MTSAINARREEDGFTLIELLVVVIIIGILAAIAIPAFLNQRENAWQSSVESDLRNAAIEIESTATQNNGQYVGTEIATALTDDVQTSDGVTLTQVTPANTAGAVSTTFCIEGSHNLIDATDPGGSSSPYNFDSSTGGLDTTGNGC